MAAGPGGAGPASAALRPTVTQSPGLGAGGPIQPDSPSVSRLLIPYSNSLVTSSLPQFVSFRLIARLNGNLISFDRDGDRLIVKFEVTFGVVTV